MFSSVQSVQILSNWDDYFFKDLENDLAQVSIDFKENPKKKEPSTEVPEKLFNKEFRTENSGSGINAQSGDSVNVQKEFCLSHLDESSFQARLSNYNEEVVKLIQNIFHRELPDLEKSTTLCLLMTGSDGRHEKLSLSFSPMELIVVVKDKDDLTDPLLKKIQIVVFKHSHLFDTDIEIKYLGKESLICYKSTPKRENENPEFRPIPTRALDAKFLAGSVSAMSDYRKQFFEELASSSSKELLKKFWKHTVKATLRVFKTTLEQKDQSHIDIQAGLLNYDHNKIKATKFTLLRAVQYQIGYAICTQVNAGVIKEKDFSQLPNTTLKRIDWLAQKKLLEMRQGETKELKKAYVASLVWFEKAQRSYKEQQRKQISVPIKDLTQVFDAVNNMQLK